LDKMSNMELTKCWQEGCFPFEFANCGHCMTQHALSGCGYPSHLHFLKRCAEVSRGFYNCDSGPEETGAFLRAHLEEFIALRLFYDSLYAPTEDAPSSTEAAVAIQTLASPVLND
jgi:hypothetical protein